MALRILLITHGAALMTKRLSELLGEAGIEMVTVEPEPAKIKEFEARYGYANIYVLYAGNFLLESTLTYLKDLCSRMDKPLCVVGYDNELEKIKKIIPRELIDREFVRPIDVNDIAENIQDLICSGFDRKMEKHILLVDDDLTFLQMMQSCLGAKYRVASACSGAEALEYLMDHTADLVLLDYDMPVMNGPQVLEAIRKDPKTARLPVMFLTGKNDRDSVLSVVNLKPDGYILKSMSSDDILASVKRFFKAQKE